MVTILDILTLTVINIGHFSPRISETCIVAKSKTLTLLGLNLLTILFQVTMVTSRGCVAGKTNLFLSVSTMTLSVSAR